MTIANVHIQQVLLRRGNTAQASSYIGPVGEVIIDTDLGTIRVQDGNIAGGVNILATQAQVNLINANITSTRSNLANVIASTNANLASAVNTINNNISVITGIDATFVANINTLLANAATQQTAIDSLVANIGQGGTANTGNIRFTDTTIHAADYSPVKIQTTGDKLHWWSEYGELLYSTQDTWASSVEYDSTGNVYVVGGTYHDLGDSNGTRIKSILLKYDTAGDIVWSKTLTDPDNPYVRGEGIWIDSDNNSYTILENDDVNGSYILKMDANATIIWQKTINPSPDNNIRVIDIDGGNGMIYVVGEGHYVQGDNRTELWVAAFDTADGTCVWQQNIDEPAGYYWYRDAYGIAYGNESVYITGQLYDTNISNYWSNYVVSMSCHTGTINWATEISPSGQNSWYSEGNDIAVDSTGNIYSVGESSAGLSLIKFDTGGNIVWQKVVNQFSNTYGNSLDFDADNNIYVTGSTSDTPNTNFRQAWMIMKFDPSGNLLFQRSFGSGIANTWQWYYDGHKEIALHGNVLAVTGYTYAGAHSDSLNDSAMVLAQLPTDGSKTGNYDTFSYQATDFGVNNDTMMANVVTFTATVSTYAIATGNLQLADNNEDAAWYPFAADTWNFDAAGILSLPAGGDIVDSNTNNSVLNTLRNGVHTATMNAGGIVVDETGRSLTGEFNGHIAPGNFSNVPLQIRHATGYAQLLNISSPQTWLDFGAIATQVGVGDGDSSKGNWITSMIVEFQALASGQVQSIGQTTSYMTGQIIIANSGNGRMSLTHTEAGIAPYDGGASDVVWTGMDLWIKDLSDGSNPKIAAARTDGHTLSQLDIQWTARVFVNPAEHWC